MRNRQRRFSRPALPSIVLSNLQSFCNKKLDLICIKARYCNDLREASLLCFNESWLHPGKPESYYDIAGFTMLRLDRTRTSGGGICVYMNDLWCRQYSEKCEYGDKNVEILGMTLRPFYLPREFGCILLFTVYVPPRGSAVQAAKTIADYVHEWQLGYPRHQS